MKWRLAAGLVLTVAYGFLLSVFTRRYPPVPVFLLQIPLVLALIFLVRRKLLGQPWWFCALIGAAMGYAAALPSYAAMILGFVGAAEFAGRFLQASTFYVYPVISLGWLYGAVIAVLLFWWPRGVEQPVPNRGRPPRRR